MAKPRIFVSSTYYDLRHIRDRLEAFIETFGYDPVLFESGDIPFRHDAPLDESCYAEIQLCHILILIVGGRYGNPTSRDKAQASELLDKKFEFYNSITRKEYITARDRDIPIFIFVEKNVLAEYDTYKQNKDRTVAYAHVESVNVFRLLDEIVSRERNNFIRGFERFDDIAHWLREQWAGLFADFLSKRSGDTTLRDLAAKVSEMGQITSALKEYSELLLRKLQPDQSEGIIGEQEGKIEANRIRAFARESMIAYLLSRSVEIDNMKEISSKQMYRAFNGSQTVEQFLTKAGFPSGFVDDFLKKSGSMANRDYKSIGERYFGRESGPTPDVRPIEAGRNPT